LLHSKKNPQDLEIVHTKDFTGRYARGIKNEFVELIDSKFSQEDIPSFPNMHYLTTDIRKASMKLDCKHAHLWIGESVQFCQENINMSARSRFEDIVAQVDKTFYK